MVTDIKNFIIGVLGSLFATFLTTYIIHFEQFEGSFNFKEIWSIVINYTFLIYWMAALLLLIMVRRFIRNRIDKSQTPYPMVLSIGGFHEAEFNAEGHGFKWKAYADVKQWDRSMNEPLDIHVDRVKGPYCTNDFREMKVSRTYWGRYKYKCPKCGYKRILLKNAWTLKCDIGDEIEAGYRDKVNAR